ncbi:family 20 glycosylhydrolase [Carboxylicivirga sp. M1479]|uniref:family 20 glycosylhydrolase n=1 Tax=Carboxylicivirga sp. M1479 TaxID=2594476 RepID=UPI0011783FFA|nr:family 20 glycosylhydrolase [Carboxylicivirga sp. M1479]TRX70498.1 family 20 glycosylhydrolase [Carboxylicivirga sp. M1479]
MNKSKLLLLFLCSIIMYGCDDTEVIHHPDLNIIPEPLSIQMSDGKFHLNTNTQLIYKGLDKEVLTTIENFNNYLSPILGDALQVNDKTPPDNYILFQVSPKIPHKEAYQLQVSESHVHIKANSCTGLFYAIQSLRQLLPVDVDNQKITQINNLLIPALEIKDSPQFEYRGFNLDVARHFYPVDFIKKQLDILALYKINVFHWHLSDDQGWRLEIKKYPRLTSIGSKRAKTLIGHGANPPFQYDNKVHSGFYTQEDVRDIIAYAKARHITVIPEIELPAHSLAALAAYPQLGCTGGPYEVATNWGGFDDVICPGKESTYRIIEDILGEVANLFPSEYIHIGGDECSKIRWRECKHCQQRIQSENLKNEQQLELYFIKRVQTIAEKFGKRMAGWDEIMHNTSLKNACVVVWNDDARIHESIANNNKIVKASNNHLYFDHYQADPQNHPLAIGGYTPMRDVYAYNPLADVFSPDEKASVIGMQANCWTEYMPNEAHVEMMIYPRLIAFAENSWSSIDKKDWACFNRKLESHLARLDLLGANYFYETPKPVVKNEQLNFITPTNLSFVNISNKYDTRYTTDGSEPTLTSELYTSPISVNKPGTIKAITIDKATGDISKTTIVALNKLEYAKPLNNEAKTHGLDYLLYKGRFKTVKEIQNSSAQNQGTLQNLFIPDTIHRESFGLAFNGYFEAKQKGIYEFALSSDDGSAMYLNEQLVVNNDGIHGKKTEFGAIALKKGLYPFDLLYFQTTGHSQLNITVKQPDGTTLTLFPKDFVLELE